MYFIKKKRSFKSLKIHCFTSNRNNVSNRNYELVNSVVLMLKMAVSEIKWKETLRTFSIKQRDKRSKRERVLERSEEKSLNIHGEQTGGATQRAFYHLRLASCNESFSSHSFAGSSVMPDILPRLLLYVRRLNVRLVPCELIERNDWTTYSHDLPTHLPRSFETRRK